MSCREAQTRTWRLDVYDSNGGRIFELPFASIDPTLDHLAPEMRTTVERANEVLLVRQSYRDGWAAPGGLLHRGEEPDVGARREVKEEVGIDVDTLGEPLVVIDVKARRIDVVFRCQMRPTAPDAIQPDAVEIVEARWFPKNALPDMQKETAGALRRVL